MQNVILVTSSNRSPEKHTGRMFAQLERLGAAHVKQDGSPDVAFARCMALTAACEVLRAHPSRDVVLMVDDDMIGSVENIAELCTRATGTGRACSGIYATQSGHLAATRWRVQGLQQRDEDGRMLWLVGLGMVAIPRALLLHVDEQLPKFRYRDQVLTAFTGCGAEDGEWMAEDYQLSRNLGGVRLEGLAFGHIKKMPLWPDQETIDKLVVEEVLPDDGDTEHVRHLDEMFPGEEAPRRPVPPADGLAGAP